MATQTKKVHVRKTVKVFNIDWKLLGAAVAAIGIALLMTVLLEGMGINLFVE